MLFILGLILTALVRRKKWPLFAFAVLWFFAGHALESTFLPLEYFFEHRNYLPLLGPIFALVVFMSGMLPTLDSSKEKWLHSSRIFSRGIHVDYYCSADYIVG